MPGKPRNRFTEAFATALNLTGVQLLLIALVGILAYCDTFRVPFLLDDEGAITDNPAIRYLERFLGGEGYRYGVGYNPRRFVGYLTLALNYRFGGLEVSGYHAINLAIHLACALLVYALAAVTQQTPFFGGRRAVSPASSVPDPRSLVPLFAALFFVAHPVQTQAVTYIVQRFTSLCTLFYLASVVSYAKGRLLHDGGRRPLSVPFFALSLVAGLLSMWTKEIAATLPLLVAAYEFSFFTRNRRKKLRWIAQTGAFAAVTASASILGSGKSLNQILSGVDALTRETTAISRGDYLITQFAVIGTYLRLLAFPVGQNLDYDYPLYRSLFEPKPFLSLTLIAALAALGAWLYLRSPRERNGAAGEPLLRLAGFGIIWFFVALSVESSVVPIRDLIFEHRVYLPSVGAFLALAALGPALTRKAPGGLAVAAGGVLVAILAGASFARNEVWRSDVALWQDVVAKSPAKSRPHHNLARAFKDHGMLAEAEAQYLIALRLDPALSESYTNLGVIYRLQNRLDESIAMHRKSMEYGPLNPSPRLNLGVVFASLKRYREAEGLFREALRLDPRLADAHANLGRLYRLQGNLEKAEREYLAAVEIDPLRASAFYELGLISWAGGNSRGGEAYLRRAAALQPGLDPPESPR